VILWIASYPRSGNSFLRVVLKAAFGIPSDSVYSDKLDIGWGSLRDVREGLSPGRSLADMADGADLCALKTHDLPGDDGYPALYVVRDGRDALVSYAHYALEIVEKNAAPPQAAFLSLLRTLVSTDVHFGGWARHVDAWGSRKATHVIRFEDLIRDPIAIVGRALASLGLHPQSTVSRVPSFAELREKAPEFFRNGLVGGYREEMPESLEELFCSRSAGAMRRHGYSGAKRQVDGPLVTVVTPSYNQGGFIRSTIESVLAQDYPHIEHLIIDGGSTDQTADVVAEYRDRLTWTSEKDRGQSDAINKGFRMARGDIVCWLNSDDVLMPHAVSKAVAALDRDGDLRAVYGDAYRIDHRGEVICEFPKAGPPNLWKLVYYSDYISQPTVFLRRRALDEVGYLDESLHWGMDWDLFIRLGKRRRIAYIPEILASQREYEDTKTASGGFSRFRELVRIMRRHGQRRYPPVFFVYGIDTCINVVRRRSAFLLPVLSRVATAALPLWHWFVLNTFVRWEGWYADQWATKTTHLLVHRNGDRIRIRGSLPEISERLRGQRLQVSCNGVHLREFPVAFGDFEEVLPLNKPAADELLEITIEAARWFVPRDEGMNDDPRTLAYLLREVA
jgi:glycosyltransferase involved in cell wall biosynthesis